MLKLNSKQTKIETNFSNCSSSLLLPASPCYNLRICCTSYCTSFNHFILRCDVRFNSYLEICMAIEYLYYQMFISVYTVLGISGGLLRSVWRPRGWSGDRWMRPNSPLPLPIETPNTSKLFIYNFSLTRKRNRYKMIIIINKCSAMMHLL